MIYWTVIGINQWGEPAALSRPSPGHSQPEFNGFQNSSEFQRYIKISRAISSLVTFLYFYNLSHLMFNGPPAWHLAFHSQRCQDTSSRSASWVSSRQSKRQSALMCVRNLFWGASAGASVPISVSSMAISGT